MLFAGTSSLTITFDCSKIYEALMKACRPQLEEAYRNARDESTAGIIERMLNAIDNNNYSAFEFFEWCLKNQNVCVDDNPQIGFLFTGSLQKLRIKLLQSAERARIKALSGRRAQGSQRLPQSDLKSIALHASMPVPPTMNWKGGQLYAQWIGE